MALPILAFPCPEVKNLFFHFPCFVDAAYGKTGIQEITEMINLL
jgi:hypothetical protein